jgi:hypothetical protein
MDNLCRQRYADIRIQNDLRPLLDRCDDDGVGCEVRASLTPSGGMGVRPVKGPAGVCREKK